MFVLCLDGIRNRGYEEYIDGVREREREKKRKDGAVSMLEFMAPRRSCGAERKGPDAAA